MVLEAFPVANAAGMLWPDDKGRIVGFNRIVAQLKLIALQQNTPNDFDLLVSERHAEAAMSSSTESDERIRRLAILFAGRSEPIRVESIGVVENAGVAMTNARRHHHQLTGRHDQIAYGERLLRSPHEHDQGR